MKEIYALELHQTEEYKLGMTTFFVTRVAGGWIYQVYRLDSNAMMATFVPFDNEFQK